ncbi:sugar transport protein 5 isoform X1 [Vigna radiata var. radiata]|uniref:Sugar transport protein 5 isoform X1 n=2 Tax=Vigna radiata var. radiata TaxID=3916 RepID=A0A1S3UGQ4_VIGRR|nr:sugar transport protein 5 isoform X1 [Vigna radiata var. radiata]
MAVGGFSVDASSTMAFDGKITVSVLITCIVAASSGLIFGYDIGITGGVTTMKPFLEEFFPSILRKSARAERNEYCVYDNQLFTLFTSSLHLAGLISSLLASRVTTALGRRNTMVFGGCIFFAGGAINGAAQNIFMLILGRILLGFGVGFTNQATPVYLSEIAPPRWRGAFNTAFQFFIGLGVVAANFINYGTARFPWGWRVSLGLATVPAIIMTIGALLIPDTPSSLIERDHIDEARNALRKVRGSAVDVEPELQELIKSSQVSKAIEKESVRTIFEEQYRPQLVMAFAIPLSQQLTGINIVAFYAPNLFQSVGLGNDSALLSAVILGLVNLSSILVSTAVVDRFGRRFLFIAGGLQMLLCMLAVAIVLAVASGVHGTENISKDNTILVLVLFCFYAAGFGWSWGPLCWLIPSEIFPLKIRSTGQSIAVAVQFFTVFVLSQTFLTMLCHFKFGAFLFYASWIAVITIFVILFLPETKGIPLDSMYAIWSKHWYWRRFVVKGQVSQYNLPMNN